MDCRGWVDTSPGGDKPHLLASVSRPSRVVKVAFFIYISKQKQAPEIRGKYTFFGPLGQNRYLNLMELSNASNLHCRIPSSHHSARYTLQKMLEPKYKAVIIMDKKKGV